MERDYAAAVAALNTLQSNFAIVEAIRKAGPSKNAQAIPEMIEWCRKAGYEPSQFDRFKPIHISGTKGKGSTSAFISSILTQYQNDGKHPIRKVGLYTSPHLRFVRERIQINNTMLSEAVFAKYFFDIWGRFESAAISSGISPNDPSAKPIYFRFLTLMAFHVFMCEGVDTAVIECGIGGEHDSTNIIVSPVATAITSLGLDHIDVLGNSLSDIAWHKAGIFKSGAAAFTVPQSEEAMEVIHKRASEKGVSLAVVNRCPEIHSVKLGLAADFQKSNASLAIAAAAAGLRALGNKGVPNPAKINSSPLPEEFRRGLEQVQWPGRCEIRREAFSKIAWCIDGAHTIDSIEVAGRWFAEKMASSPSSKQTPRILLFNQQKRDADALATSLHKVLSTALDSGSPFTHVVFCTNVPFVDAGYRPDLVSINTNAAAVEKLSVQNTLAETWKRLDSKTEVVVKPTIEEAVHWCRDVARTTQQDLGEEAMVLVTGSLHLVGGVIEVLETGEKLKN